MKQCLFILLSWNVSLNCNLPKIRYSFFPYRILLICKQNDVINKISTGFLINRQGPSFASIKIFASDHLYCHGNDIAKGLVSSLISSREIKTYLILIDMRGLLAKAPTRNRWKRPEVSIKLPWSFSLTTMTLGHFSRFYPLGKIKYRPSMSIKNYIPWH